MRNGPSLTNAPNLLATRKRTRPPKDPPPYRSCGQGRHCTHASWYIRRPSRAGTHPRTEADVLMFVQIPLRSESKLTHGAHTLHNGATTPRWCVGPWPLRQWAKVISLFALLLRPWELELGDDAIGLIYTYTRGTRSLDDLPTLRVTYFLLPTLAESRKRDTRCFQMSPPPYLSPTRNLRLPKVERKGTTTDGEVDDTDETRVAPKAPWLVPVVCETTEGRGGSGATRG